MLEASPLALKASRQAKVQVYRVLSKAHLAV